ncbi:hypothetical protein OS11_22900 [Dickeya oryzae]
MNMQETVLTKIVRDKALWVTERKQRQPLDSFQSQVTPSSRHFYQSLKEASPAFILECKKSLALQGVDSG